MALLVIGALLAGGCKKKEKGPVLGEFEFLDERDGQVYSWVLIAGQKWMTRNLNFATESGSWCYNGSEDNCLKYGRLYSWSAARSACPAGWHLSTDAEWERLDAALGMNAGHKLKGGAGWTDGGGGSGGGGFNAFPGGDRSEFGSFGNRGKEAYFWTATSAAANEAYGRFLTYNSGDIQRGTWNKKGGNSVRCIKDKETTAN